MINYNNQDMIIARATPIGKSALALIRITGQNLLAFCKKISLKKKLTPRYTYVIELRSPQNNDILDRCVLTYFKAPQSFTGEDMIEITCHGGDVIVNNIIKHFISVGLRVALPGEFSYRAFQNNKIDLLQAEAIALKINQTTNAYNVTINNMESGRTSKKFQNIKEGVLNTMTILEHELDFNEFEINHLGKNKIKKEFMKLYKNISEMVSFSYKLQAIGIGYQIVIIGFPNVGKSTLFNNIIGTDKAIVTNLKGTTRDVLEAQTEYNEIPITFFDTAGFRKTKNKIETIGIAKMLKITQTADIILILDDVNPKNVLALFETQFKYFINKKTILVTTKADKIKSKKRAPKNHFYVSCHKNEGINELLTYLLTLFEKVNSIATLKNEALCSQRQIKLLEQGMQILKSILNDLETKVSMDIISYQCKEFIDIIEELLGHITPEHVLTNIFKGFCVGK